MKRTLLLTAGILGAVFLMQSSPAADPLNPRLIVPGKSLGSLRLGPHGVADLKKLRRPNVSDAGMSQTRQVWVSSGAAHNTLFLHTVSNGALDVPPLNGLTITEIRVTSPWFHTRGGLTTGSALAQIRRRFPHLRREGPGKEVGQTVIYQNAAQGIAFEFARDAPTARCLGITVYIPGDRPDSGHPISRAEVEETLRSGDRAQ